MARFEADSIQPADAYGKYQAKATGRYDADRDCRQPMMESEDYHFYEDENESFQRLKRNAERE